MNKQELIVSKILMNIGEDPNREGLVDTPRRVVKSWKEIYSGYEIDPASLFTTFKKGSYDQIIYKKNIPFYSMCEHHMLPFYGVAHIGYLPDKRVLGTSKFVRVLDVFARRLQIQERLCEQVTTTLMKYLKPLGAGCVIEATHMCEAMRGVNKATPFGTSSMKGLFLTDLGVRAEFLGFIK